MSRSTGSLSLTQNLTLNGANLINSGATLTLPITTDTLIGRGTTDILINKTLTNPIISTISNTGTLTLPTNTDTLIGRSTTDTLTNKTLTNPIISTISNTGTLTLPITTDTLIGRSTTDTLTNKTLTGTTNTIDANNLRNGSTWVVPLGGTSPVAGQLLTYNGSNAVWLSPFIVNTSGTVITTNATSTAVETIATSSNLGYFVQTSVIGRRTDTGNQSVGFKLIGMFQNIGGTLTQVGVNDSLSFGGSTGYTAQLNISGANIQILVTGVVANTVNWKSVTTTVVTN